MISDLRDFVTHFDNSAILLLELFLFASLCQTIFSQSSTTRSAQPVVYTAETARQLQTPYPSTSRSPVPSSAQDYNSNSQSTTLEVPEADNVGFVDPSDFNKFLSNVAYDSGSKKPSSFNPFTSETKSKDSFPDFFNSGKSQDNAYFEPFSSLSSSASNQNSRKPEENVDGFVDPSVQFRSLFDSTETADGFQPEDYSSYNGESVGSDPSKGSQTRAYPSFTYTGRQDGEDEVNDSPESSNPRYRSSYRQVNGRERNRDPYDDKNYYGGEYDNSPRAPSPPPRKYHVNNGNSRETNHPPASQETSHSPQSGGKQKGEAAESQKSKCKKVEKEVDYEDDYESYVNPEEGGYDPSTYSSRYKRQARNQKKKGRPMTCYVCEDEEGRYAERCSYDSNSDPKNGGYFHSSSTSYNDNGKRPSSRDRHRRNPKATPKASKTLVTSASGIFITSTRSSPNNETLPRRLEKRQSQGSRYADRYRDPNSEIEKNPDNNYFDYEGPQSYYNSPTSSNPTDENEEDESNYGFSPSGPAQRNPNRNNNNNRHNQYKDFDFGPPADFGKDAGQDSPGFVFDYDPKEFERPSGHSASNSHNRPVFSSEDFNRGFDVEYDDYIKKYFPDAFGTGSGGSSGGNGRPSSRPPRPEYHHEPARSPPSGPSHRGPPGPDKENTQPAYHYTPYHGNRPEYGPEPDLQKAITSFSQKDRGNCQRVSKGDMTCYVCRDPRGMNKEECMSNNGNDPRNSAMSYSEVTEYSNLHPSKVLPGTKPKVLKPTAPVPNKEPVTFYDFDY